jgi:hypothetical protein
VQYGSLSLESGPDARVQDEAWSIPGSPKRWWLMIPVALGCIALLAIALSVSGRSRANRGSVPREQASGPAGTDVLISNYTKVHTDTHTSAEEGGLLAEDWLCIRGPKVALSTTTSVAGGAENDMASRG